MIPRRWLLATSTIVVLALLVILLSVVAVTSHHTNSAQDLELAKANARLDVIDQIRVSERKAAAERACGGVKLGNALLAQIQAKLNAVAEAVTSEEVRAVLMEPLPQFPVPKQCEGQP